MTTTAEPTYISQEIDHLGFLNGQLRGLMGYAALANELIQNADDAKAENLIFDVTDDALIVENDSVFSECESVGSAQCSTEALNGRLCDFHRFRKISLGDKRKEENTIGAFGLGFTSVYQITDRPELTSGTRHWTIFPEEPGSRRIIQNTISREKLTRFRFPWARDAASPLRQALGVEAVPIDVIDKFCSELQKSVANSIMFLNHVRRITLKRNGRLIKEVFIKKVGTQVTVVDGQNARRWTLFDGFLADEAKEISNPDLLRHRKTKVTIALPVDQLNIAGLLFAYLPTEHVTGLPFHLNADFFTEASRKDVVFSDDYQSDWNRSLIRMAAKILTESLPDLREVLGAKMFWELIGKLRKVAQQTTQNHRQNIYSEFWQQVQITLKNFASIYDSRGNWVYPSQVLILKDYKNEKASIPLLGALNLEIVHEDLSIWRSLLQSADVGVHELNLTRLADALCSAGLNQRVSYSQAPGWLQNADQRRILTDEINYLMESAPQDSSGRAQISQQVIALTCDNHFNKPAELFVVAQEDQSIFEPLGFNQYFAVQANAPTILSLIDNFDAATAIRLSGNLIKDEFEAFYRGNSAVFIKFVNWLVNKSLNADEKTKKALCALPIWLSGSELHVLSRLVVPAGGDFKDHLNLALLVDLETLEIPSQQLLAIGAPRLTFRSYITEQLPTALRKEIAPQDLRDLVDLIAQKKHEVSDDDLVRQIISRLPIIECRDGRFHPADKTYFATELNTALLGEDVFYVEREEDLPLNLRELYRWLEIPNEPIIEDLLTAIERAISAHATNQSRKLIKALLIHIGTRWNASEIPAQFEPLKSKSWLPAEVDEFKWYRPHELFPQAQKDLVGTIGKFIDLSVAEERSISKFIKFLKLNETPPVKMVVDHLLKMIETEKTVSFKVYDFLEKASQDSAISALRGKNCILVAKNQYVSADKVFWSEAAFGSYRYQLSTEYQKYQKLLTVLGVKNAPDEYDAAQVLREIGAKYAPENLELSADDQNVVRRCWHILKDARSDTLSELRQQPVILVNSARLDSPENVYFDDFPGAAEELGLAARAIPIDRDFWQPMHQAGVRFLSHIVEVDLIEKVYPSHNEILTRKMSWAHECIRRVVEAARRNNDVPCWFAHLKNLNFVGTTELLIQYQLVDSDQSSEIISSSAFYDSEHQTVFYQSSSSQLTGISREIARSISTQLDIGSLASGIKEILSANSFLEAARNLNELGYANIDWTEIETVAAETVTHFDMSGEEHIDDYAHADEIYEQYPENHFLEDNVSMNGGSFEESKHRLSEHPHNQSSQNSSLIRTNESSVTRRISEPTQHRRQKSYSSNIQEPAKFANSSEGHKPSQTKTPRARGRFLSYAEPNSTSDEVRTEDPVKASQRRKIDQAGIFQVLKYEELCGRDPMEMRANNPGYDIKSFNQSGQLERLIEVKSISGEWGESGVKLTDTQYQKNLAEGDRFWLYVVERATETNFKIYCIKNPASHITDHCFDYVWKLLDEQ